MVKNLPAMWETWVRWLGWEDSLEEGMATHSSILAWKSPVDRGAWRATVHGVTKSLTQLSAVCMFYLSFMFVLEQAYMKLAVSSLRLCVYFCLSEEITKADKMLVITLYIS